MPTTSPRRWVESQREQILAAFDTTNSTGKSRAFLVDGKTLMTKEYVSYLLKKYKAELNGVIPRSIESEIGVLLRKNGANVLRIREPKENHILSIPKVFEVRLPGSGIVLMLSTRDPQTKILFEVGLEAK